MDGGTPLQGPLSTSQDADQNGAACVKWASSSHPDAYWTDLLHDCPCAGDSDLREVSITSETE